jgi:thiamine biosynthesis lipoprotein ApbE
VATYIEVDGHIHQGGMLADAYATTLAVMPWEIAQATLEKTENISGVIVHANGTFFQKKESRSELFGGE